MQQRSMSHKILKNVAWNFIGQSWLIVLLFLSTPFIVHRLNVNLYGIYTLASVIVGYFSFLQLGLVNASIKYMSQYLSNDEHDKVRSAFWACVIVYLFMGSAAIAAIFVLSDYIVVHFFKMTSDLRSTAIFALRIASLGFLLSMMVGVVNGVIRTVGRFDILNRITLVLGTVQTLATVTLLYLGFSLRSIVVSNLLIQLLNLSIHWYFARKLLPFIVKPVWDSKTFYQLLKYSGFVAVQAVTAPILANTEKIFITALRSVSYLTYYSIPYTIVSRLSIIPSAVLTVLFPIFSRHANEKNTELNKELFFRSTLYMVFIYIFIMLFFIFFGRAFFLVWIGSDFAEKSTTILQLLLVAGLIHTSSLPSTSMLMGVGKPQVPAVLSVIQASIYVPLSYVLIKQLGGIGAAIAWLLCTILNTVLLHMEACRSLKISLISWYASLLIKGALPFTLGTILFLGLDYFRFPLLNPLNIIGIVFIAFLYGLLVWLWGLDAFAREKFRSFLQKRVQPEETDGL